MKEKKKVGKLKTCRRVYAIMKLDKDLNPVKTNDEAYYFISCEALLVEIKPDTNIVLFKAIYDENIKDYRLPLKKDIPKKLMESDRIYESANEVYEDLIKLNMDKYHELKEKVIKEKKDVLAFEKEYSEYTDRAFRLTQSLIINFNIRDIKIT